MFKDSVIIGYELNGQPISTNDFPGQNTHYSSMPLNYYLLKFRVTAWKRFWARLGFMMFVGAFKPLAATGHSNFYLGWHAACKRFSVNSLSGYGNTHECIFCKSIVGQYPATNRLGLMEFSYAFPRPPHEAHILYP